MRETSFRMGELAHTTSDYSSADRYYAESLYCDEILGHNEPAAEQLTRDLFETVSRYEAL